MKLVRFKDGTYGARRLTLGGYMFKDFKGSFWWSIGSKWMPHCRVDREKAQAFIDLCRDAGSVVKKGGE